MNTFNTSPDINQGFPEGEKGVLQAIDLEILEIVKEINRVELDILEVEKNDGDYPQSPETASKLRALNDILDELKQEKADLLGKKLAEQVRLEKKYHVAEKIDGNKNPGVLNADDVWASIPKADHRGSH